jgi:hypothetical protein
MKFTISNLKKGLAKKTKQELVQEILILCQKFPQVKEYYKAQGNDVKDVLMNYKDIIEKEFVEGKTRGLPKGRLSVAKKAVNDFKKLNRSPELIAEIMFTYVESLSWFSSEFCPDREEYYTSPEDIFEDVLGLLKKNNLLGKFERRAYKIVKNATDGWGYQDSLQERYEDVYGDFKD